MDVGTQAFLLFLSFSPGPQPVEWYHPHSGRLLPPLLNFPGNGLTYMPEVCFLGHSESGKLTVTTLRVFLFVLFSFF